MTSDPPSGLDIARAALLRLGRAYARGTGTRLTDEEVYALMVWTVLAQVVSEAGETGEVGDGE